MDKPLLDEIAGSDSDEDTSVAHRVRRATIFKRQQQTASGGEVPLAALAPTTLGSSGGLGAVFWKRLMHIWRLGFTGGMCGSMYMRWYLQLFLMLLQGFVLFALTLLLGPAVQDMVDNKQGKVWADLAVIFVIIAVIALIQAGGGYLGEQLRLDWRRNAVAGIHREYFVGKSLFWLNTLCVDVDNVDQRIASDIETLTLAVAQMLIGTYVGFGGLPFVLAGVVLPTVFVARSVDIAPVPIAFAYAAIGGIIVALLSIPVQHAAFRVFEATGSFRFQHVRAKEFCEAIVFYGGQGKEATSADGEFNRLFKTYRSLFRRAFWLTLFTTSFLNCATYLGTWCITVALDNRDGQGFLAGEGVTIGTVQQAQSTVAAMVTACAAIPALFSVLGVIASTVHRVGQMLEALELIKQGQTRIASHFKKLPDAEHLGMDTLSCRLPNGKLLYNGITFDVTAGKSVIIMGASGCGKSSLLRIMAGLWPYDSGTLRGPRNVGHGGVFFVPQRTYLTNGSLRRQIMYPADDSTQRLSDAEMAALLRELELGHLLGHPGGLDAEQPWPDVLSGGEGQRLGFARLIYHRPRFAIMDESTSALDVPLEAKVMEMCERAGITCVSVGHRPTLVPYHQQILRLTGGGAYELEDVDPALREEADRVLALAAAGTAAAKDGAAAPAGSGHAAGLTRAKSSVDEETVAKREQVAATGYVETQGSEKLADVKVDHEFRVRLRRLIRAGFPECCGKPTAVLMLALALNALQAFAAFLPSQVTGELISIIVNINNKTYGDGIRVPHPAPLHASADMALGFGHMSADMTTGLGAVGTGFDMGTGLGFGAACAASAMGAWAMNNATFAGAWAMATPAAQHPACGNWTAAPYGVDATEWDGAWAHEAEDAAAETGPGPATRSLRGTFGRSARAGSDSDLVGAAAAQTTGNHTGGPKAGSSADWTALYAVLAEALFLTLIVQLLTAGSQYVGNVLSVYWYRAIVQDLHTIYYDNKVMYAVNMITRDIDNVDQRICADALQVALLGGSMLFGGVGDGTVSGVQSLAGAFLTFVIGTLFALQFAGWLTLTLTFVTCIGAAYFSLRVAQPITASMYRKNKLEGNFRFLHARVREYAESIAFYEGQDAEAVRAGEAFDELWEQYHSLLRVELPQYFLQKFFLVCGGFLGFLFYYIETVLFGDPAHLTPRGIFTVGGTVGLMMNAMLAVPGYITILSQLAGPAHRVFQLLDTSTRQLHEYRRFDREKRIQHNPYNVNMDGVTVRTPTGSVLFKDMTFHLRHGDSMVIMGPSGSGKSSLLRVMGGLWPFEEGHLSRPMTVGHRGVLFLPQRAYLTAGSLRAQLVYPLNVTEQPVDDLELLETLRFVKMDYLLSRDGGLDAVAAWPDELSGGEQQRLGFARLFIHKPTWAFMDESTSALDVDMEDACMKRCAELEITCVSVGHRPSLVKHHRYMLRLDGTGGYDLVDMRKDGADGASAGASGGAGSE